MNKILLTTITILLVIGVFVSSPAASKFVYSDYTTLSYVTAKPAGYVIVTTKSTGSEKDIYLYKIIVSSLNTTANVLSMWDGETYAAVTVGSSETKPNRAKLVGQEFATNSTYIIGGMYHNPSNFVGDVDLPGKGIGIGGDVAVTYDFTSKDGEPMKLKKGVVANWTAGVTPVTFTIFYRKD